MKNGIGEMRADIVRAVGQLRAAAAVTVLAALMPAAGMVFGLAVREPRRAAIP